jgi:hypothetical protein
MVHDAIAYAPYIRQFINQTYTAYELHKTIYQSNIYGLRVLTRRGLTPRKTCQASRSHPTWLPYPANQRCFLLNILCK